MFYLNRSCGPARLLELILPKVTTRSLKPDFIHKLAIALKESVETEYWLCLLRDGRFITSAQAETLLVDYRELQRILTSSIKTAKTRL